MSSLSVWPTSTITRSCPSSVKRLSGTVTAVTGDGGMPCVHLVPEQRPRGDAAVHLRDRSRGGDDTSPEPFCQQPGGEPVIAVAVGDEDVGQVPALGGDPVAERTRLICRHPGVRQHRILAPVDQRAGLGREPLRLPVRKETVPGAAAR